LRGVDANAYAGTQPTDSGSKTCGIIVRPGFTPAFCRSCAASFGSRWQFIASKGTCGPMATVMCKSERMRGNSAAGRQQKQARRPKCCPQGCSHGATKQINKSRRQNQKPYETCRWRAKGIGIEHVQSTSTRENNHPKIVRVRVRVRSSRKEEPAKAAKLLTFGAGLAMRPVGELAVPSPHVPWLIAADCRKICWGWVWGWLRGWGYCWWVSLPMS